MSLESDWSASEPQASFDHRFIDGAHVAVLARTVKEMMENPFEKFDKLS